MLALTLSAPAAQVMGNLGAGTDLTFVKQGPAGPLASGTEPRKARSRQPRAHGSAFCAVYVSLLRMDRSHSRKRSG
jgi:hypothetical protein